MTGSSGRPRLVKLVRDRIGQHLADDRVTYEPMITTSEARDALRAKLVEEAVEYLVDPADLGELCDVLDVIEALAYHDHQLTLDELIGSYKRRAKLDERGGFMALVGMFVRTSAPTTHEGQHVCGAAYDDLRCDLAPGHEGWHHGVHARGDARWAPRP